MIEDREGGRGAAPRRWLVINAGIAAAVLSASVGVETARGGFTPLGGVVAVVCGVTVVAGVFLLGARLMSAWRRGAPGPDRPVGGSEPGWRPRAEGAVPGPGTGGDRPPM
ncbi:hypothetical protein GCM10027160_13950 [Streptomyces calidiresistens]|uniref:Uncharacterized protein n=1 Tax=Streptomyces calidiresistens TaxID=1485586 RepID=A0A7W3T8V6_9ACTN|nr:hypothetical protein [Streptomyces calidiresistens]MBB0233084.1 hypothetical protein [Streptomyces calidiresistens]